NARISIASRGNVMVFHRRICAPRSSEARASRESRTLSGRGRRDPPPALLRAKRPPLRGWLQGRSECCGLGGWAKPCGACVGQAAFTSPELVADAEAGGDGGRGGVGAEVVEWEEG